MTDQEKQIVNKMAEGTDADGGLTVPQDLQTAIKELKRSRISLENHVNVENTSVNKGRRVIEKDAAITAWPAVDEAADFTEGDTPTLKAVDYSIKKYGDIMKLTNDLLADTAENLLAFLANYCAKREHRDPQR
ncbi:MAG: phage major capsid protein [Acutalibacteraceae bacterium]